MFQTIGNFNFHDTGIINRRLYFNSKVIDKNDTSRKTKQQKKIKNKIQ